MGSVKMEKHTLRDRELGLEYSEEDNPLFEHYSKTTRKLSEKVSNLRVLDVDDMIILSMLKNGVIGADIARTLCISHPAISHRLKKMSQFWGEKFAVTCTRDGVVLNEFAAQMASASERALKVLVGSSK